jgi:hypothetical protein
MNQTVITAVTTAPIKMDKMRNRLGMEDDYTASKRLQLACGFSWVQYNTYIERANPSRGGDAKSWVPRGGIARPPKYCFGGFLFHFYEGGLCLKTDN